MPALILKDVAATNTADSPPPSVAAPAQPQLITSPSPSAASSVFAAAAAAMASMPHQPHAGGISCLYCAEVIDTAVEDYCQLGGRVGRFWHTRCVERSRERREHTMMLIRSMNQLADSFFQRLSTPPSSSSSTATGDGGSRIEGVGSQGSGDNVAVGGGTTSRTGRVRARDTGDEDDPSASNTEEVDPDTEGFSSATESDITISQGRAVGGVHQRKTVITLWDDSDVSDAEATMRRNSLRKEGAPFGGWNKRPPVVVGGPEQQNVMARDPLPPSSVGSEVQPDAAWNRPEVPKRAGWRPQATVYRSISFELDSAGNTIRPRPKRQRGKEARSKKEKEKEAPLRHHRNTDAAERPFSSTKQVMEGSQVLPRSVVSQLASPKEVSSSSSTSEDDASSFKERPKKKKKKKHKTEKGTPTLTPYIALLRGDWTHLSLAQYTCEAVNVPHAAKPSRR